MKLDDIVALAKAGYTAEQISQLATAGSAPAKQEEAPQTPAEPAPEPKPQPAPKPKPQHAPEPKPQPDYLAVLSEQMEKLTAAIQANGILGSSMPPEQNGYDILGNILRPNGKEVV